MNLAVRSLLERRCDPTGAYFRVKVVRIVWVVRAVRIVAVVRF